MLAIKYVPLTTLSDMSTTAIVTLIVAPTTTDPSIIESVVPLCTITSPVLLSVADVAAFDANSEALHLTSRLNQVSQGALFMSPLMWRAHFMDNPETVLIGLASDDACGADALPAPPATSPESAKPIAKMATTKKKHPAAKIVKLLISAAPAGNEPCLHPKPVCKICVEAPGRGIWCFKCRS